jgi:hypothetical protein
LISKSYREVFDETVKFAEKVLKLQPVAE